MKSLYFESIIKYLKSCIYNSYTDSSKEPHSTEYKCNETEKYTICNINEGELVDSGDLQQDKLIYNEVTFKHIHSNLQFCNTLLLMLVLFE